MTSEGGAGRTGSAGTADFEEEWRRRFDRFAARFEADWTVSGWSRRGLLRRMAALDRRMAALPVRPGGFILDVGCGPGLYVEHLAVSGYRVLGIDYSLGMLTRARRHLGRPGAAFAAGEIYALPCRDAAADALITIGVFQHLRDAPRALRELRRVTTPGGILFLDTLNGWSVQGLLAEIREGWRRFRTGRPRHAVRYRAGRLLRTLRDTGFVRPRVTGIYILPRPLRWLEPLLDILDRARLPGRMRPVTLPLASTFLVTATRE